MPLDLAVWIVAAALVVLGLAGSVLPALPGAPLILAAALLHKVLLPAHLSWATVAFVAAGAALSFGLDLAAMLLVGRRLGATAWGLWGAGLGALAGLPLGPAGLLAGAVAGAAAAELLLARQGLARAARAGLGAGAGLVVGGLARGLLAVAMAAALALDWLF